MQVWSNQSFRLPVTVSYLLSSVLFGLCTMLHAHAETASSAATVTNGTTISTHNGALRVEVCNDDVLHITAAPSAEAMQHPSPTPWIISACKAQALSLSRKDGLTVLRTASLEAHIAEDSGMVGFFDLAGNNLLQEQPDRSFEPLATQGPVNYRVQDNFKLVEDEAIYGLGQHQSGSLNNRGLSVYLSQKNTDVAVPVFVSTRGYGVIWNTASSTLWDNRLAHLLTLTTAAAKTIDYYFIYGPEPDQVIHQYRELTGHAPMFGKWAYGFFQSKDHYQSQAELLQVEKEYRNRHIPLDTIVQDAPWWTKQGSDHFNENYPDFAGAVDTLHRDHAHVMLSIWPNFDADTPLAEQMKGRNMLLSGTLIYDATNPEARDLYWKGLVGPLFDKGVDAFWLDASEPEQINETQGIQPGSSIYLGDSALYTNVYPTAHSGGIYEHWRAATSQKRVFILTRSAFLGNQKNAAATWSGDVYSTFWSLSKQVPAGLNFVMSGLPYWTTDTGGYGYPAFKSTQDPDLQELFTRWLEYSVFCPLFRSHGHRADNRNEFYSYGQNTPILIQYDKLRYRLLPYIYSLAWKVTDRDYTLMRPLVMDWRNDNKVWEIGDEFMFGPSLLVAPVTQARVLTRPVYLPNGPGWYDFWTGASVAEGQIESYAHLDRIPVYVRAGSILPLGPEIEFADQKPTDPIELRVYRGANGQFDLYDDAGDGYGYEQGERSLIPVHWNEATKTLTIGERSGSYPGMPQVVRFNVVFVGPNHGSGENVSSKVDKEVIYSGRAVQVIENADSH